ncbi:DUF2442 domain-containing protein [Sphingorhabdus sp. IMCC26285]|jgi:hypothetical protein|uniref:DUF2442 domain-containing protein n=1 Tax=Sphingorhabdus profundilacus TaxID=2509718 RepID=A0A6I4LTN7_9SPHN|nr:DUF2442 domain-containing protein [Sphingorhabdus profundilacus]MVZ96411.1 DUF2442 domain-containing protein [Sphingorhabdus profundilacus]
MVSLPEPTKISFDQDSMWVTLDDGRVIGVPLAWFPRLLNGSEQDRQDFFLSPSGMHWEALDEDISVRLILSGRIELPPEKRYAA